MAILQKKDCLTGIRQSFFAEYVCKIVLQHVFYFIYFLPLRITIPPFCRYEGLIR